jgi:hypothetical protein
VRNNVHVEVTLRNGERNPCHGEQKARSGRRTTHEREENDRHHRLSAPHASPTSSSMLPEAAQRSSGRRAIEERRGETAVDALADIGPPAVAARPRLVMALHDADSLVRRVAKDAIDALDGKPRVPPPVREPTMQERCRAGAARSTDRC